MTNEQTVGLFFLVGLVLVFVAIEVSVGTSLSPRATTCT